MTSRRWRSGRRGLGRSLATHSQHQWLLFCTGKGRGGKPGCALIEDGRGGGVGHRCGEFVESEVQIWNIYCNYICQVVGMVGWTCSAFFLVFTCLELCFSLETLCC